MSYYNQQPPVGVPPQQGYPPEGYPKDAYPPQGYPQGGYPPPQGYPPQGYPPQQGYPAYAPPPPQYAQQQPPQKQSAGLMEGWYASLSLPPYSQICSIFTCDYFFIRSAVILYFDLLDLHVWRVCVFLRSVCEQFAVWLRCVAAVCWRLASDERSGGVDKDGVYLSSTQLQLQLQLQLLYLPYP